MGNKPKNFDQLVSKFVEYNPTAAKLFPHFGDPFDSIVAGIQKLESCQTDLESFILQQERLFSKHFNIITDNYNLGDPTDQVI